MRPLFSILIVSLNPGEKLKRTLGSALKIMKSLSRTAYQRTDPFLLSRGFRKKSDPGSASFQDRIREFMTP